MVSLLKVLLKLTLENTYNLFILYTLLYTIKICSHKSVTTKIVFKYDAKH